MTHRRALPRLLPTVALALILPGCEGSPTPSPEDAARPPAPAATLPHPTLRRLTAEQYGNTVRALFGADIVVPTALEPDAEAEGLLSVGAATTSISALGVERYEDAAFDLAAQVVEQPARRAAVVPCEAERPDDAACADTFARVVGRRAWRRPLTDAEAARIAGVVTTVGAEAGAFDEGLRYGLVALLTSPRFLYRDEHGAPDPADPSVRRLDDYALATRLSYLLWATTPDDALLDAAAAGALSTEAGLAAEADRMLADPRARSGLRALFTEVFRLWELDAVSKDPTIFTHASAELGPAAREETLRGVENLVFDAPADLRALLTTRTTFVDPRLAALYRVAAPNPDGFGEVTLEADGGRRGLLGQASFLMLQSHATRTSATLRGQFIRTTLLCQAIPPPPAGVDTSIPEADATSPTLRDRLQTHLEDPACASCHQLTDPLGLGLENFDGLGRWRDTENEVAIDASGTLDGEAFADAWELGGRVAEHPALGPCLTRTLYRYAMGHGVAEGEEALVDWLADGFAADDHAWLALVRALVTSPAFRRAGALDE